MLRNVLLNELREWKGFDGFIIKVFLGIICLFLLCIIVMKLLVVGLGLICKFGNFCFSRYWMNVVLLVEYWFISKIIGFVIKLGLDIIGEWNLLKR